MSSGTFRRSIGRRAFLGTTAAAAALAATSAPRISYGATTVKVGFLAPLTGDVAAWGLPGLHGCELWAEQVNTTGGVRIRGEPHRVELIAYDNEYVPDKARSGAQKLIYEDGVQFIMMLGGDTWPAVRPVANQARMLVSTLLASDLSPDAPFLIAPCEVHPIYNVTGVQWLAENKPDLNTAAICAQNDSLGRPSVAAYLAAFEAAGIDMLGDPLFFDLSTTDFAPVVAELLSRNPDILCLDTAYADYVHSIVEQAFLQGYEGQIISCTADFYEQLIEKTSKDFMEGFVFQFPDFDDPALNDESVNFSDPNGFHAEYNKRWPGEWSAVSWQCASILDLWRAGVEIAGTADSAKVLAGMKAGRRRKHAFGDARWWGKELFGIDNALVGNWPVVAIEDGKARIKEFKSIPAWWDRNSTTMIKHFEAMGAL